MAPEKKKESMSRGSFLGFLAKIGLLSALTSIPAFAGMKEPPKGSGPGPAGSGPGPGTMKPMIHSGIPGPTIKGKKLSDGIMFRKLSSDSLEHIRDITTGRFFGTVGERVGGDYSGKIGWDLGQEGFQSCVVATTYIPGGDMGTGGMSGGDIAGMITNSVCTGNNCPYGHSCSSGHVCDGETCGGQKCGGQTCRGGHTCSSDEHSCKAASCPEQKNFTWQDFANFPNDEFVKEITSILQTTDIGIIRDELTKVMVSGETIQLGQMHFVQNAFQAMQGTIQTNQPITLQGPKGQR